MRALQVVSRGVTEYVETPKPDLQAGHVLLRPLFNAICGSDICLLHHSRADLYPFPPGTTGHEVIAQVEAIDADQDWLKVGDVTLTIAPDFKGMAEWYLAPLQNVLPLPTGKTPEELLMAQQLGTVIYACKELPSVVGKTVAVVGQGSAGLWFNFMLKRLGARQIVAIDSHEHRLSLSQQFGATEGIHRITKDPMEQFQEITGGKLANIVVIAAGKEGAINLGIDLAKEDEGFLLQFGVPHQPLTVEYEKMFMKCLCNKSIVKASREKGHTSTIQAMELINSGTIDVSPLLTHRFPFEKANEAFEVHRTCADGAVKVLIDVNP